MIREERQAKKKPRTTGSASSSAAAASSSNGGDIFESIDMQKTKKMLTKKAIAAVKRTKVSSHSSKPWVEVNEGMRMDDAKSLIGSHGTEVKDTKQYYVRALTPSELAAFLPALPSTNLAHYTGKVWCFPGATPKGRTNTEVIFEKAEYKYSKSSSMLTLRMRIMKRPFDVEAAFSSIARDF